MQRENDPHSARSAVVLIALVALDAFLWFNIFSPEDARLSLHFLDVGQGDSELVVFPSGAKMMVDAGKGREALYEFEKLIPSTDRYIDLVVISHAQLDHFGGFYDIVQRYEVGAVLWNGRGGEGAEWDELVRELDMRGVPVIPVGRGDRVVHGDSVISILSPDPLLLQSADLNDTSIVARVNTPEFDVFLGGDIGVSVEEYLARGYDLSSDVLKVNHHGSAYSSNELFLADVHPKVAVIGVGENTYGHPTPAALLRLEAAGARVFRTDTHGTVTIRAEGGMLRVFAANSERGL